MGRWTRKARVRRGCAGLVGGVLVGVVAGCGSVGGGGGDASGSGWEPSQDVTIVVPYAPGGGSDVFGRALAKGIESARSGVNVTVENRPGGSGTVGYSHFYTQQGNPHYLLPSETAGVVLPFTTEVPWTWQDFTPIMQIAEDAIMVVVAADSPYQNLQNVMDAAEQGESPRIGLSGSTGPDAIVTRQWEQQAGTEFRHVAFGSGGEIVAALLGGDIDMGMLNPSEAIGQIEGDKLRGLAVFAAERYERAPLSEVPTGTEQGVDVTFAQYRGVFAPGDLSEAQIAYWVDSVTAWTRTDAYREGYIQENHLKPVQRKHEKFVSYLEDYETQVESALDQQ